MKYIYIYYRITIHLRSRMCVYLIVIIYNSINIYWCHFLHNAILIQQKRRMNELKGGSFFQKSDLIHPCIDI